MRARATLRGRYPRPEGTGVGTPRSHAPGPLQLAAVLGLALLATAIFGVAAFHLLYDQRILLGVTVHDLDVGGLRREDAGRLIGSRLAEYGRSPIVLRLGEQEWKLSPGQMGVQFDGEKTANNALQAGKQENPLDRIAAQIAALGSGVHVSATFTVDPEKYAAFAKRLALQIDEVAVNAALKVDGGQVRLIVPREGLELDQAKLQEKLEQEVRTLSSSPIELPVTRVSPKVTEQNLASAQSRAQQIVSGPVTVTLDGRVLDKWTVNAATLASMVVFEQAESGGRRQVTAGLNQEMLRQLADKIAAEVYQKPLNARFDWNGGRLKPISSGRDGRALDVGRFVQDLESVAASSEKRTVALSLSAVKPRVGPNDAARLGLKGLVEERRTDYSGGADERRYNIRLGASRVHGVVVPPGETFSFNDEVGEVTEENGYKLGFAIIGGDTVPDPGGGICQVSTTVFQSIFWAGYQIVERYAHDYRIRRYEQPMVGLDAAIYPPDLDMRFRNNSDAYILIQTRMDDKWLYVSLYGSKPNWVVSVDEPRISNVVKADAKIIRQLTPKLEKGREVWVETAEDGLDVTVSRTVRRGSEVIIKDKVVTRYRPERNVILVGTGGAPASPD